MDLAPRIIDSESIVPLYKQLFHCMNSAIENHESKPGNYIPSEKELAREINIRRVTICRALQELAHQEKVELFRTSKSERLLDPKEVPGKNEQ